MIIDELFETPQRCPECGGISFSNLILAEKKDACYHKVKASAKVWPSAYASGRLVQCRKKGAANYGNKSEGVAEGIAEQSTAQGTADGINTSGAKSLTKKALGKVGRAVMPTLGFTDAAERLSNKDYTGAGISAAAGGIGLIPAWPAQLASGGLELVNMTRDEANALGGYDKLAKEISKNFTPATDPSYLPENPAQSEGVVSGAKAAYNRGKDFVKYLRRDSGITSQDMATQRNVGGNAIPSLGQPGKVVTSPTADKALVKLGGKNVDTTPGPTVKSGSSNDLNLDPVFDVPAYVRQGKPDPSTTPKPGSKPTIKIQPGETMDQAVQRTKAEQDFGKFLQGQGGQKFGNPNAAQATSGPGQVPTIRLPDGSLIVDPYRLSPSGNYNTPADSEMDKIMAKWDRENNPAKSKGQLPWGGNIEPSPGVGSSSPKSKKPGSKFLQSLGGGTDKKTVDEESRKKRKEPEAKYDDQYDAMVARVRQLAGIGPMKTVWDPAKRVYKNVPTAVQPKK